jgi:hypothetical protein
MKLQGKISVVSGLALGSALAFLLARRYVRQAHIQQRVGGSTVPSVRSDMGELLEATPLPPELTNSMQAAVQEAIAELHQTDEEQTTSPAEREGAIIGNRRTLIYHSSDSRSLPVEENREYFTSEAEAIQAGYHRAENE